MCVQSAMHICTWMHTNEHRGIYIHAYIYIDACVQSGMHMYVNANMCTYIYIRMNAGLCMSRYHTYVNAQRIHIHVCVRRGLSLSAYTHVCTCLATVLCAYTVQLRTRRHLVCVYGCVYGSAGECIGVKGSLGVCRECQRM